MKSKTTIRILALILAVIFLTCNIRIENVSAFWNQDNPSDGDNRKYVQMQVQLMHCNCKDTHYVNGVHIKDTTGDTEIKNFPIIPRVNNDLAAGTSLPDTVKYVYEYELSYAEGSLVDYAVITHPDITHFSSEEAVSKGLVESHARMYWIGEYSGSIAELTDEWSNLDDEIINVPDNEINWWDFAKEAFPTVDPSLSRQTWETISTDNNTDEVRTFIITPDIGDDCANGQRFIFLNEGTFLSWKDAKKNDEYINEKKNPYYEEINVENHPARQDSGVPSYYGRHIDALIGLVFYRSLDFDANGGTLTEGSPLNMQVYNGSNKGKLYTWYSDKSKRKWYSDINIASPQVTTPYGTASVKNPTREGYKFLGWYAPQLDSAGTPVRDSSGSVVCSDVMLYDTEGRAVLGTEYFDNNGNWIYKGNVTAYAKWEDVGCYTLHYDKGESNNYISMPNDTDITVATGHTVLADSSYITGSDYIIDFKVYTNNGNQAAGVIQPVTGRFPFFKWKIDGALYDSGDTYSNPNAAKGDTLTATAVYGNIELTLPSTSCSGGYTFEGWYTSYDETAQTFDGYAGGAGDKLTINTSRDTVSIMLYAKWAKADLSLAFDYNVPGTAAKSRLGYVLSGDEIKSKTVQYDSPLGELPHPALTGYKLSVYDISDGWSKFPNRSDGTQVENPVTAQTVYDGSYSTLYAQWQPVFYSIKYDLDGGWVPAGNPTEANYYKEITIYSPSREGSTFLGWSITDMDGNRHIIDGKLTNTGLTSYSGVGKDKEYIKVTGLRADTGTVTLTALWQDTHYSIAYDYRDSESNAVLTPVGDPGNPSGYDRNTQTFTLNNPDVKGYHFISWGGTGLQERLPSVTIQQGSFGDRKYTAYFMPAEYEILYELSGGSWDTGASHPDRAKYNRSFNVSHPVMEGCTFAGWEITRMCDDCEHKAGNSAITGTDASGVKETSFMNLRCNSAEKVLFTAKWSHAVYDISFTANAVPNKYTVTFDANGGSCVDGSGQAVQPVTVTYGSADYSNISGSVKAMRTGYVFAGWTAGAADSQDLVWDADGHAVDGSCWNMSGNSTAWSHAGSITVYAVWKDATPPAVNVSPESTSSYTTSLSVTVTVTDNELLSADNIFEYCLGTDSSAPPSGASWGSYRNGIPVTIGSTLSGACYMWVKHVKDAAGNASVSSPNADYHRFGPYYFDNTAPDLSGVLSSYPDLNRYPHGWYPEGTTVTFDIADAHSGIKSAVLTDFNGVPLDNGDITSGRQYYFGSEGPAFYCLTVTDNMGNTAKKLFIVKIDSKGEVIPDNAVWKGLGNLALFAHWTANSYTVHFEKNDDDSGSTKVAGSMPDATFTYDRDETLPANGFSRTGYYFDGWNESADGTANNGRNYPDKAAVRNLTLTPGGKVTLYAQWKPCSYTLTFNYNKPGNATGTLRDAGEASRTVTFDVSIGRLPEPKLTGWTFEGWYIENADGTSVKIGDNEIWHYTSGKTAVAKWTSVKYEVRLHSSVPEDALGQLKQELDVSTAAGAENWTWCEAEYYSAIFTYDSENSLPLPQDTYALTEYSISGWYANELLSDYIEGGEFKKWNLSAVEGTVVDLYPVWRDTSAPEINVTPTRTVNPDADNDAVKSLAVTITVTEHGSGLRPDNRYEYGFSESSGSLPSIWETYCDNAAPSGFTVTLPDTGAGMDGYYYLWVRRVMDNSGNSSESPSAVDTLNGCHVFGIYVFDNTAPDGNTEYIENNLTLGLYNDTVTDSPYAVMTIHDPHDDIAGIAGYVLRISDADAPSNSADYSFTPDAGTGTYTCSFNLYDSLPGAEDIEKVHLQIIATDRLGNEATIPITRYDFGTLQTGAAIRAEDIGYRNVGNANEYVYERDNFRVEAYIEAVTGGTQFKAGQWGTVRIYTFGYVDEVEIDFGSLMNYYNPQYDRLPTLIKTTIDSRLSLMYRHEFAVPLYCTDSSFNDTKVIGYKKGGMEQRYVVYNVKGSILDDIRTILKYKIY